MRPEFMIERNGKSFCLYAGLLDEAHQQGLKEIRTTLLQIPADENGHVAICQSEVQTEKGIFTGLGDASPQNVARPMQTCLIRMAETRAKARALRDAVNVGVVALEELPPEGDELPPAGRSSSRIAPIAISEAAGARAASRAPGSRSPRIHEDDPFERPPAAAAADSSGSFNSPRAPRSEAVAAPRGPRSEPVAATTNNPAFDSSQVAGSDPMTPAQRRMLESLARQAGETIDLDDLSRRQASQLITELKSRTGQPRAA